MGSSSCQGVQKAIPEEGKRRPTRSSSCHGVQLSFREKGRNKEFSLSWSSVVILGEVERLGVHLATELSCLFRREEEKGSSACHSVGETESSDCHSQRDREFSSKLVSLFSNLVSLFSNLVSLFSNLVSLFSTLSNYSLTLSNYSPTYSTVYILLPCLIIH